VCLSLNILLDDISEKGVKISYTPELIPGAQNSNSEVLPVWISEIEKVKEIVVYCVTCNGQFNKLPACFIGVVSMLEVFSIVIHHRAIRPLLLAF
jgi:hypothetical protein